MKTLYSYEPITKEILDGLDDKKTFVIITFSKAKSLQTGSLIKKFPNNIEFIQIPHQPKEVAEITPLYDKFYNLLQDAKKSNECCKIAEHYVSEFDFNNENLAPKEVKSSEEIDVSLNIILSKFYTDMGFPKPMAREEIKKLFHPTEKDKTLNKEVGEEAKNVANETLRLFKNGLLKESVVIDVLTNLSISDSEIEKITEQHEQEWGPEVKTDMSRRMAFRQGMKTYRSELIKLQTRFPKEVTIIGNIYENPELLSPLSKDK